MGGRPRTRTKLFLGSASVGLTLIGSRRLDAGSAAMVGAHGDLQALRGGGLREMQLEASSTPWS